jgi:membrane protein implicated in regulation of membrane protease activity
MYYSLLKLSGLNLYTSLATPKEVTMMFGMKPDPSKRTNQSHSNSALADAHLKKRGIVTEIIRPGKRGRVAFQATTWFAFCYYQVVLMPGMSVCVVDQYNATTLIVEPVPLPDAPSLSLDESA